MDQIRDYSCREQAASLALFSKTLKSITRLNDRAQELHSVAYARKALAKYEQALHVFRQVQIPREQEGEYLQERALAFQRATLCCLKMENFSVAVQVAEQASREFPSNQELRANLAYATWCQGQARPATKEVTPLQRKEKVKKEDVGKELKKEPSGHRRWGWALIGAGVIIGGILILRKLSSN